MLTALLCSPLCADGPGWRAWDRKDGLTEPFTHTIAADAEGNLWVKHGDVNFMSILDGYGVRLIPDPRTWKALGMWSAVPAGIKTFTDGKWTLFPHEGELDGLVGVAALDANRGILLTAASASIFSKTANRYQTVKLASQTSIGAFTALTEYRDGIFWIIGERGLARCRITDTAFAIEWTEFSAAQVGLLAMAKPLAGYGGELFLSGLSLKNGKPTAVRFDGRGFRMITQLDTASLLLVWPGPEGTVWVDDGAQPLLRFSVDGLKRIDRREVFAGQFHNVMPERNGNFWVATSAGVVHYAAPLWRPPAGGESIETPAHSIVEDRKGAMWFAGGAYLSRWDGKSWRRYFLPKGAQHTSFFLTTA